VRFRRSRTLVLFLEGDQLVFHNYLAQTSFSAKPIALDIVRRIPAWSDAEALSSSLEGYSRQSVEKAISDLIALGALITEGSEAAEAEAEYEQKWQWGPFAAAYHFGTRGTTFEADETVHETLAQLTKFSPSPPLYQLARDASNAVTVPLDAAYEEPFLTMGRRRTNRLMLDRSIPLKAISDCLLFSMAITAVLEDAEIGDLPLKMTPSGGARNPYEAYVCARRVEGLEPGVYHYSAFERSFEQVRPAPLPSFTNLIGGQDWGENASAMIFLVADFARTMWKYHDAMAYRVVMIEAGHIAQNIMLAATKHGLHANPTGALNADAVEATLGVSGITKTVVYALGVGHAEPGGPPQPA
jgi:SagB-type dehydrogenase family enzyme